MEFGFKYTVVVPHYNDGVRVKRLLDSLPLRNDIQTLVIDDCSPDQEFLQDVKVNFPHVCFLSTPCNMGAGAARNIGLENVEGQFVLFADADDEFLPDAFDVFDKNLNTENDITYFLAEAWQEEGNKPSVRAESLNNLCINYLSSPNEEGLVRLKLNHCVPWAKVYSHDFVRENYVQFDNTFVSNDVYFNVINAVLAKRVKVIGVATYKVYRLVDSLTSTTTAERLIQRVEVSAKTANKLKDLRVKHGRSATGYLLESIKFGPLTFLKVLAISIGSDLSLNPLRILNLKRWLEFFQRKLVLNNEKRTKTK